MLRADFTASPRPWLRAVLARWATIACCAAGLVVATAAGASAQSKDRGKRPGSLAVFSLQGPAKERPPGLSSRLTRTVAEQARARGHEVEEVNSLFADTTLLLGCDPQARGCQQKVLRQLDSKHAIFGTVAPADRPHTVVVSLTMITRGGPSTEHRFTVPAETADQAAGEMIGAIPVLFGESPVAPTPTGDIGAVSPSDAGSAFRLDNRSWAFVGSGAAVTSVGILFWFAADRTQSSIDEAPTDSVEDLEQLEDRESAARTRANIGNVLVAAGLITASIGIVRAVVQYRRSTIEVAPVSPQGTPGVTVTWSY